MSFVRDLLDIFATKVLNVCLENILNKIYMSNPNIHKIQTRKDMAQTVQISYSWRDTVTFARVIVADIADSFPHNLLVVDLCLRIDLSQHHNHSRLGGCLCNKTTSYRNILWHLVRQHQWLTSCGNLQQNMAAQKSFLVEISE